MKSDGGCIFGNSVGENDNPPAAGDNHCNDGPVVNGDTTAGGVEASINSSKM